ncbi:MAG: flagellin [Deltaproteobacteria bacterium]|nr:flagellin [Deltaproteobacteria bacterium]
MGLRIQTNIAAINAHRQLGIADAGLTKSLERLSSGYRINRAADDAAGLSISQQFRADIASYKVASRNAAEATSLLQVAEGGVDQIGNMLTRLKELATQAASATAGSNLGKINAEGNKLIEEIDRIAQSTEYAGTKLLNGTFGVTVSTGAGTTFLASEGFAGVTGLQSEQTYNITLTSAGSFSIQATVSGASITQTITGGGVVTAGTTRDVSFAAFGLTITLNDNYDQTRDETGIIKANAGTASNFQVGAKNSAEGYDKIGVLLGTATSDALFLDPDKLLSATDAQTFMATIDTAIGLLNTTRGDIGAAQNRLGYAAANLLSTIENVQAAESVIRDVDMAAEMTSFTKNQILLQAGTAMLAQANMAPQSILSLISG